MLEVSGLVKAFGNLRAVDSVDLMIEAGTITGLIGPNGAGKTTLFNLIAGALAPESGAIRFMGERIVRLNRRGVTFLVIQHNLDLVMTVCRPIAVMAQGKLIYHGDAAGVRRDRQVLDAYLGDMPA